MMSLIPKEQNTRKWLLQIIIVVLLFGLLCWGVWLYYNYQITQIQLQTGYLPSTIPFNHA